jgi:hypothetical protein
MTTSAARRVVADCHVALQLLEEEQDSQRWRVHWAAAVALIRAVGHVLDKVDGIDPKTKKASKMAFKRWRDDPDCEIFRSFIEFERNNILKEYRFGPHPTDEVELALSVPLRHPETGEAFHETEVYSIGENIYKPMLEGFREGDDARDVLAETLEWWSRELDAIDATVGQLR